MTTALATSGQAELQAALLTLTGGNAELSEADLIFADSPLDDGMAFDFAPTVIKVAGSGAKAFVDGNDDMIKAPITGVILGAVKTRGLWLIDGEKVPFCSSNGGVVGHIRQGVVSLSNISKREFEIATKFRIPHPAIVKMTDGEVLPLEYPCLSCPMNDWNTSLKSERGRACSEKRRLLFLIDGYAAPVILNVPTMSIKSFNDYVSGIQTKIKGGRYYGVRTQIDVVKVENTKGDPYGQMTFKLVERITDPGKANAVTTIQRHMINFLQTAPIIADEYDMPANGNAPAPAAPPEDDLGDIPFDSPFSEPVGKGKK